MKQNRLFVLITLLAALLCIWATDLMLKNKITKWLCWLPLILSCLLYQQGLLRSDYGARGIVLAVAFYLFDGKQWWKRLLTVLGCILSVFYGHLLSVAITLLTKRALVFPTLSRWDLWQLFSLCALPLIFLYNGKKGPQPNNKVVAKLTQLGFYLFYPAHMLVLWLIAVL